MGCFRLQEQAHGAVHESILVTKSGASVGGCCGVPQTLTGATGPGQAEAHRQLSPENASVVSSWRSASGTSRRCCVSPQR